MTTQPDTVQTWLGTGYGVVMVAILSGLIAPWIMELMRGQYSRGLETHKLKLKRAELLFEREISAANAFLSIQEFVKEPFLPGVVSTYAETETARRFSKIEDELREFKHSHFVVLDTQSRSQLNQAIKITHDNKFEVMERMEDVDPWEIEFPPSILAASRKLLDTLDEIELRLVTHIKGHI